MWAVEHGRTRQRQPAVLVRKAGSSEVLQDKIERLAALIQNCGQQRGPIQRGTHSCWWQTQQLLAQGELFGGQQRLSHQAHQHCCALLPLLLLQRGRRQRLGWWLELQR
jgi:hypothetical protein